MKINDEQAKIVQAEIGVYDSGVGGISFLPSVQRLLPAERLVYFGDLANAPYGERSQDFILQRARVVTAFFKERGVKAMVIACNTATSAAAAALRAENPDLPILGMEPAVHLAVKNGEKRIIALATDVTTRSTKLQRLLAANSAAAEIMVLPCPGLMELIEIDLINQETEAIRNYLQNKLNSVLSVNEDVALVLGCTHYIFLRSLLKEMYPKLRLYDGNLGTALNLRHRLQLAGLLQEADASVVSSQTDIPVFGMSREKFTAYLQLAKN